MNLEMPYFRGRLVVALLCAASVLYSTAHADSLKAIEDRGYINIVTEDDYAPFEFIENGIPTGFNNEMFKELEKYADFDVRQDIMPFRGLLSSVLSGKYDVAITGAIITKERLRVFDFAMPYSSAQHYCVKRAGDDRIKDTKDLSGLTLGIQAGSALVARLPELRVMLAETDGKIGTVREYTSYPEIYQDLENKRVDYAINTVVNVNRLIQMKPDVFASCGPVSGPGYIAYPVKKGNQDLLEYINKFILHMRDTGRLAQLQEKWFGESFTDLPQQSVTSFEQFKELTGQDE